jgi:hypothetical protein
MNEKNHRTLLNDKFKFLKTDYEFEPVSTIDDPDFYKVILKNSTTGIAIIYEYRDANVFIYLYKLINGQIIEDKLPIVEREPLNSIELSYIVQYRDSEKLTVPLYDDSSTSFEDLITKLASNLRMFADDVLRGDFSIYLKVDKLAKKRRLEWQNK